MVFEVVPEELDTVECLNCEKGVEGVYVHETAATGTVITAGVPSSLATTLLGRVLKIEMIC